MDKPSISIIMPVYNGRNFVHNAVDSLYKQNIIDWELIISDDCSEDLPADYLKELKDSRIHIYYQKENLGIFGNLNFLFSQASSEISFIFCQDDYLEEDALNSILNEWYQYDDTIGFICFNQSKDNLTKGLCRLSYEHLPTVISPKDSDKYFFIFGNIPGNLSNVSVRTKLIEKAGGFDTNLPYAGDFAFWVQLGRTISWARSKSVVSKVIRHNKTASVTLNRKGELIDQQFAIIESLYYRLKSSITEKKLKKYANSVYVVYQLDAAFVSIFRARNFEYLKKFLKANTVFMYGKMHLILLYIYLLGGRNISVIVDRAWEILKYEDND